MFEDQRRRLLEALDDAHDAYYRAAVFGGPSLHFHLRSLEAAKAHDFAGFSECVYALLASWGMHRMGRGGSKMREFRDFQASLKPLWPVVLRLRTIPPEKLDEAGWADLRAVFTGTRCMASGTSLVGNSKVMAHAIPNLVPPVDREYTLKFLFRRGQIRNGLDLEWAKLEQILRGFFYPVLQSAQFRTKSAEWTSNASQHKWDTSPLKVIDNLVIGMSKMNHA